MKRDLWKELSELARKEVPAAASAPFGLEREILRRVDRKMNRVPLAPWIPMLRPALVLAVGVMGVCLAIQFATNQGQANSDLLAETDALMITAFFDEQ